MLENFFYTLAPGGMNTKPSILMGGTNDLYNTWFL
jgi:hypothetical protein